MCLQITTFDQLLTEGKFKLTGKNYVVGKMCSFCFGLLMIKTG